MIFYEFCEFSFLITVKYPKKIELSKDFSNTQIITVKTYHLIAFRLLNPLNCYKVTRFEFKKFEF